MKRKLLCGLWALISACALSNAQEFKLNPSGYFQNGGVDVMAFDDIYPEGHQGGVCIIMHGNRVATNGDIRLEQTPDNGSRFLHKEVVKWMYPPMLLLPIFLTLIRPVI